MFAAQGREMYLTSILELKETPKGSRFGVSLWTTVAGSVREVDQSLEAGIRDWVQIKVSFSRLWRLLYLGLDTCF